MGKDLSSFLSCDQYCDFDKSVIWNLAIDITHDCTTDKEKAIAIFYWVRDNILYSLGSWNKKASQTIRSRNGTCTNSANVFVALCRAIKIPAGFGVLTVHGRRYFGPVVLPMMEKLIGEISTHIYATVFLNGEWIKVDPSDDYELSAKSNHICPTSKMIDFDGENHAELHIEPKDIIKDTWPLSSILPWMEKKPKNGKGIKMVLGNRYIQFLRTDAQYVRKQKDLQAHFILYLFANSIFSLGLFFFLLFILFDNVFNS